MNLENPINKRREILNQMKSRLNQSRFYPIWFMKIINTTKIFLRMNYFWIEFITKVSFAVIFISLPFVLFFILRITLPVPNRISIKTNIPISKAKKNSYIYKNFDIKNKNNDYFVGNFPYHYNIIHGIKIPIGNSKKIFIDGRPNETIEFDYSILNSNGKNSYLLKIQDENYQTIYNKEFEFPPSINWDNNNLFSKIYFYRIGLNQNNKFFIHDKIKISKKINVLHLSASSLSTDAPSDDKTQLDVVFGNLSTTQEIKKIKPVQTIFILLNGLNDKQFSKVHLYQNLKKQQKNYFELWNNYYLSSSEIKSLKNHIFSQEIQKNLNHLNSKIAYIGAPLQKGDLDSTSDLFSNISYKKINNIPQYETPENINDAIQWISENSNSSYLLFLNLGTLQFPYYPPSQYIDFWNLISNPFGLNAKKILFESLEKFQDDQLSVFLKYLKKNKNLSHLNIVITSLFGTQIESFPWKYFPGVDLDIEGASASPNHDLFEEDIHVPLLVHYGNLNQKIYENNEKLLSDENLGTLIQNLYLSPDHPSNLTSKDFLPLENKNSFGVLKNTPKYIYKYIVEKSENNRNFYLTHSPWKSEFKISPYTEVTSYEKKTGHEHLISVFNSPELSPLKKQILENSEKNLKITIHKWNPLEKVKLSFHFNKDIVEFKNNKKIYYPNNNFKINLKSIENLADFDFILENNRILDITSPITNKIYLCPQFISMNLTDSKEFLKNETCYFNFFSENLLTELSKPKDGVYIYFSVVDK